ncbi:hypothetical protein ACHQM5_003640 [Ranunculus cassubicifolius]
MNTQQTKPSSTRPKSSTPLPKPSSLTSHFAMIELKQRILSSISKLSDRDTHQIAVEDLENIISTISTDGVSMFLNCLYDASNDPKPSVKKESLRLIALLCSSHGDSTSTHLTKIIAHIVKRVKDSDSGVRDSCRDAIGGLSGLYLKGGGENLGSVVSLFVKPLFDAMNEEKKAVQAGAAMCMARMVECAGDVPVVAFQKLCPRICKYLNSQQFLAKAALLSVIASLSQVGAIAPQSMPILMQSIHDCLESSDWTTRKAAADTICALSSHASHLITEKASSTISVLEASRFDKVKPVRDSITDALQILKKIGEKESDDGNKSEAAESIDNGKSEAPHDPISDSHSDTKDTSNLSDKTVSVLKKKAPALSNKEVNPEFFQKLETKGSGDFAVEVAVPNRHPNSSRNGEESSQNGANDGKHDSTDRGRDFDDFSREKWTEARAFRRKDLIVRDNDNHNTNINRVESTQREREQTNARIGNIEGSVTENKGNWIAIQRQLSQLERQQSHLMNMLQDFMGGSHNSMVTLENRVRGLERIIEDMQRDLVISSGRRGYPQVGSRGLFGDSRFQREQPSWNSFSSYETSRTGITGTRRVLGGGQNDGEQVGSTRRAWDKVAGGGGGGRVRLGEGPSARSVWHASKDEATLEAIRFAGDDNGTSKVPLPEHSGKTLEDEVPATWGNVMDAIRVGNMEMAYGEVLSSGDDFLLVKLMDKTGPVMDQLSDEMGIEILHAIRQFLLEQNLFDIALSWIHQLVELVMEHGPDVFAIPFENKREILLSLREAAESEMEVPQNWEGGMMPDQLMLQLASAWEIDLQQ